MDQSEQRVHRSLAFERMERLVQEMQDPQSGVRVRSQKQFLTSIPSAFTGYDVIEWLCDRLKVDDAVEAVNIANQLCHYGYFFPVSDSKNLVVKDDGSLYRFQIPYYWPSHQTKNPDNVDYAIFLVKRNLRNKQRHGLEDFEVEALNQLRKNLANKWNFITVQAEEQIKLSKDRKKGEKIVGDSQEKAYWRVHRPPPGYSSSLEPIPLRAGASASVKKHRSVQDIKKEIQFLRTCIDKTRQKVSTALENLIQFSETYSEYDPMQTAGAAQPANPWTSDDITFWQLNSPIVEQPTEKRVKRWGISMKELVTDPTGLHEFTTYLTKEYCLENIRFWMAVNDLRRSSPSTIVKKVHKIYDEYLAANAKCQINIDGKTTEKTLQEMTSPSRFTFDAAADHVYTLLLKKDCYPRFIRSDHYKNLLQNAIQPTKKRFDFFGLSTVGLQARAKNNPGGKPLPCGLQASHGHAWTSSAGHSTSSTRRRGSDRSLSGSTHELAVPGSKGAHSHSQSNIADIANREKNENLDRSGDEVCPWDFPDPPPERPRLQPSPSVAEDNLTADSAFATSASRKNSAVLDSSSSSDISASVVVDVAERLKKTCGLQDFGRFSRRSSSAANSKQVDSGRPSVSSTEDLTATPFRSFDSNAAAPGSDIILENESVPHVAGPSSSRRRSISSLISSRKCSTSNPTPLISVSSVTEQNEEKRETVESATTTVAKSSGSALSSSKVAVIALKKSDSVDIKVSSSRADTLAVASTSRDLKTDKGNEVGAETGKANSPNEVCPWEDEENCKVKTPQYRKVYETFGYL